MKEARPLPVALGRGVGTGRWPRCLRIAACLCLAFGAATGCSSSQDDTGPAVDYFTWINPITGVRVALPQGWRQSPETAAQGETTVGYFTPNFSRLLYRYGHITLHYEYVDDPADPMTLRRFVDNFCGYMDHLGNLVDEPQYAVENSLETARLSLRARYSHRDLILQVRFWTPDHHDYWYAVVESELQDRQFPEIAAPVVDLLRQSTLPQ